MRMDEVVNALERIANALEEQNKPKGLANHWSRSGLADCYSKHEIPLPTANNTPVTASHDGDILYKPIDKPNWYNIKDDPYYKNKDLENGLYD